MKKIILLIKILFILLYSFAQKVDMCKDSVFLYSITNTKFKCIIDSFIVHEQQYRYYDSSVVFPMTIDVYPNYTMIQMFSGHRSYNSYLVMEKYLTQILVSHQNHLFIVTIRTNGFLGNLFEKTNLKKEVCYLEINKKSINEVFEDELFKEIDDYWATTWIYQFKNDCFVEKWKSPQIEIIK